MIARYIPPQHDPAPAASEADQCDVVERCEPRHHGAAAGQCIGPPTPPEGVRETMSIRADVAAG